LLLGQFVASSSIICFLVVNPLLLVASIASLQEDDGSGAASEGTAEAGKLPVDGAP